MKKKYFIFIPGRSYNMRSYGIGRSHDGGIQNGIMLRDEPVSVKTWHGFWFNAPWFHGFLFFRRPVQW